MVAEQIDTTRSSGWTIVATAIGSAALLSHHPSHGDSPWNPIVHGGLIALLVVQWAGFLGLAERLGRDAWRVRVAWTAQAAAVAAWCGAASINGFVVPHLLADLGPDGASDELLTLCHAGNQVLAALGSTAMSGALVAWSGRLVGRGGAARVLGAAGLLVGGATLVALATHRLQHDLHGMLLVGLSQSAWTLAVGVWLLRSRRGRADS